jgi:hypothetical protein
MKKRIYLAAAIVFLALVGLAWALTPPPPPPPPVGQNLGIYDTSIAFLQTNATDQSICRACHQTSGTNVSSGYNNTIGGVPTRHHKLVQEGVINPSTNAPFGCPDCHPSTPGVGNGILLVRSCTECHNPSSNFSGNALGGHVSNLSRPHHFNTSYDDANIGNPVAARQCKTCHGSFVANYNDNHYKPSYDTSLMITPWASFKITNFSQPLPQLFHSDGTLLENKVWGGCESCHLGTVNASNNNSLAAQGLFTGTPLLDNHDSHHQTILDGFVNVSGNFQTLGGRTPGAVCSWCHVIQPGQTAHGGVQLVNITNEFTGELVVDAVPLRNSTIESTDVFEPGTTNITINGTGCEKCHDVKSLHNIQFNYVQNGQQGLGHINNNLDCSGCHDEWLPATDFVPGAIIPTVNSVSPAVLKANTATTLTIAGLNFVNDVYTSVVTVDGVTYNPTSITDAQIVVDIPALSAGSHVLQVVKNGDTLSKLSTLTVMTNPAISSAKLVRQGRNMVLTVTGTAFGTRPATNAQLYVSAKHAGNQITSTSISSWSDTQIKVIMPNSVATNDIVTVLTATSGEVQTVIS